jgi:hypothetical protein
MSEEEKTHESNEGWTAEKPEERTQSIIERGREATARSEFEKTEDYARSLVDGIKSLDELQIVPAEEGAWNDSPKLREILAHAPISSDGVSFAIMDAVKGEGSIDLVPEWAGLRDRVRELIEKSENEG